MNYHKLISDAAVKLNSLVNEIIDACDKEGTPVNPGTIISDLTARAFPEKDSVIIADPSEIPDDDEDIRKLQEQWPEMFGDTPEEDDSSAVVNHTYVTSTNKKFRVLQAQTGREGNVIGYAIEWLDSKQRDFMAKDTFDNSLRTGGIKESDNSDDHFGEEQAEGLSNLLEGLRDTPHDNRW